MPYQPQIDPKTFSLVEGAKKQGDALAKGLSIERPADRWQEIAATVKPEDLPTLPADRWQAIADMAEDYWWLKPEHMVLLAQYGATNGAIDAVAQMSAANAMASQMAEFRAEQEEKKKSEESGRWGAWKSIVRTAIGVLQWTPEVIQNYYGSLDDPDASTMRDILWSGTTLGQMAIGATNDGRVGTAMFTPEDTWLPQKDVQERQSRIARQVRGTITWEKDGEQMVQGVTIGRDTANLVFDPGTVPYNVLSGVIDAAITIVTDPTNYLSLGAKSGAVGLVKGADEAAVLVAEALARGEDMTTLASRLAYGSRGANTVPLLSAAEVAPIREALRTELGLIDDLAKTTVPANYEQVFRTNPTLRALVDRLARAETPLEVVEDVMGAVPIPPTQAVALARTKNTDDIVKILATLWSVERGALPTDPRLVRGIPARIGDWASQKIPLVETIKKSRFLTEMAGGKLVLDGENAFHDAEAVRTMVSYMRTASVPSEQVAAVANKMMEGMAFEGGTVVRRKALDSFYDVMKAVYKADGHPDEAFDVMFGLGEYRANQLKAFLLDREGTPFDGDYIQWLRSQNVSAETGELLDNLLLDLEYKGKAYGITSPIELVNLLDRTVYLPPLREVRRVTRNTIFREIFGKMGIKKIPIGAAREYIPVRVISDPELYAQLTTQIDALASIRTLDPQQTMELARLASERAALVSMQAKKVNLGKARPAFELIDWVQMGFWKVINLSTGGFVIRNGMDAQMRMLLNGYSAVPRHPVEWFNLVTARSKNMDLLLESVAAGTVRKAIKASKSPDAAEMERGLELLRAINDDVLEAYGFNQVKAGLMDPSTAEAHLRATNNWPVVNRFRDGKAKHTTGVIQEGWRTIVGDPLRRMVLQHLHEGVTPSTAVDRVVKFLMGKSTESKMALKQVMDLHEYGFVVSADDIGRVAKTEPVSLRGMPDDILEEWLRQYVSSTSLGSANILTGNLPEAQFLYAYGYVPFNDGRQMSASVAMRADEINNLGPAYRNAAGLDIAKMPKAGKFNIGDLVEFKVPVDPTSLGSVNIPESGIEIGVITRIGTGARTAASPPGTPANFPVFHVQPVHPESALVADGSVEARQLVANMPIFQDGVTPGLPANIKMELRLPTDAKKVGLLHQQWDRFIDVFFNGIAQGASRSWERSPTFREEMYQAIYEYVGRLRPEDANSYLSEVYGIASRTQLIKGLRDAAANAPAPLASELTNIAQNIAGAQTDKISETIAQAAANMSNDAASTVNRLLVEADKNAAEFVGDAKIIEAMKDSAKTPGTITRQELDDYAKWRGATAVKEVLYDASSRTNIEDTLRIIYPFIAPWREVTSYYGTMLRRNPLTLPTSAYRVYNGAVNADPENDGRGIFYRDPQTDDLMFQIPATGMAVRALTGLNAPFQAPLKRLSQGLQVTPSFGPLAQLAYSQIAPHMPNSEALTEFFLPYGTQTFSSTAKLPGWIDKVRQAITADETAFGTVYANSYYEVFRALAATGKYGDLSSVDDIKQLEKDARAKARIITFMRGLIQFTGPTSGTPEFVVPTKEGDIYASELTRIFYELRANPDYGYEGSVPEFLRRFGDDAAIYMSSKTKAVVDGLEATWEYQQWAEENKDLIEDYPRTSRYLAPAGSEFLFGVWDLQLKEGERVYQDDRAQIAQFQNIAGAALYAAARRAAGPDPTDEERDKLREYRRQLHQKYPGFPEFAEFNAGEFYNQIAELELCVKDKRLAEDPVAQAVDEYLTARNAAIEASGVTERGFASAKKAADERQMLAGVALSLMEATPGFQRIYDRLLASELE